MRPADEGPQNSRKKQLRAKKKSRPVPTPRSRALAQERSYRSQGTAVKRTATQQRNAQRTRNIHPDPPQTTRQRAENKPSVDRAVRESRRKVLAKRRRVPVGKILSHVVHAYSGTASKGHGNRGLPGAQSTGGPSVAGSLVALHSKEGRSRAAVNVAPIMEQLTRPNHAIMGAARHDVQQFKKHGIVGLVGHGSLKEAKKGIQNKTKFTGSDVLKEAGVKKGWVRTAGGLALDFTLDPTVGAKATRLAPKTLIEREAARATTEARRAAKPKKIKGVTVRPARPKRAEKLHERAAKLTEKAKGASTTRGIQVGYDAKVPFGPRVMATTTGKTSSKIGKKIAPAAERVRVSKGPRTVSALFNPTARKAGETFEESQKFTYAERKRRAGMNEAKRSSTRTGTRHARSTTGKASRKQRKAGAERKVDVPGMIAGVERAAKEPLLDTKLIRPSRKRRAGAKGNEQVRVDARTNQTYSDFKATAPSHSIHGLPPRARAVGVQTRKELGGLKTRAEAAKVLTGERDLYYPHRPRPSRKRRGAGGGRPANFSYGRQRLDERPIAEQEAERAAKGHEPIFSTDHPTVMADYKHQAEAAITDSKYLSDVAKAGKPLNRENLAKMRDTDELYEITPTGIKRVQGKHGNSLNRDEVMKKIAHAEKKNDGDTGVTILPRERADSIIAKDVGSGATRGSREAWHTLNKPMAAFKTAATVLNAPFYQLRNMVDDGYRAWTGDTQGVHFVKAAQLVKDQALLERRETNKLVPKPVTGDIEIGGVTMPRAKYLKEAIEDGAGRSGFAAGSDLAEGSIKPAVGARRIQPVNKIRQWSQNLEDVPRMASYTAARDRGFTRAEAQAHMRVHMFDYDELTDTERAVRALAIPFYTYAKNNTLLHAKLLVGRPGKPAAIQKLREAANNSGADSDKYRKQVKTVMPLLKEAQSRGIIDGDDIAKVKKGDFSSLLSSTDQRGFPFLGPDGKLNFMPLGITDLNRIPFATSWEALNQLPATQFNLALSMVGPVKDFFELPLNYSTFFRQPIHRDPQHPYAEKWVAAPGLAAKAGLTTKRTIGGKTVDAWPAKTDYLVRSFGPQAGLIANLGNPVRNSRGQTTKDLIRKQVTGIRATDFDDRILAGIMEKAIKRAGEVDVELQDRGDIPNDRGRTADGFFPTKKYAALGQEKKDLVALIDHIKKARGTLTKPKPTLSPRPLTPEQAIQKKLKAVLSRDPGEEIDRKLKRLEAKQKILDGG